MKKIVCIFVCTLLIATVIPVMGSLNGYNFFGFKTYGIENYDEISYSIEKAIDGGFIIAGKNKSDGGYSRLQINKITEDERDIEWVYQWGPSDGWSRAEHIRTTSDGNYILVGSYGKNSPTWSNIVVIKLNPSGSCVWSKTFGHSPPDPRPTIDYGYDVQERSEGGYIIAGAYGSTIPGEEYNSSITLIKIDQNGNNPQVKKYYMDPETLGHDRALSVRQISDGGYIVTGNCYEELPQPYAWLVPRCFILKTDFNLNKEWMYIWGNEGQFTGAWGHDIQIAGDGGFIVCGAYFEDLFAPFAKFWMLKTNENGVEEWNKTYGDGFVASIAEELSLHGDKHYVAVGAAFSGTEHDTYIVRVALNGTLKAVGEYGGDLEDVGYTLKHYSRRTFAISGFTDTDIGNTDTYILKASHMGNEAPEAPTIEGENEGLVGVEYNYTFYSKDPDVDNLKGYVVNWGDDSGEDFIEGPFTYGENATVSHTWTKKGTYTISAKAIDEYNLEGDWGILSVKMPVCFNQGCTAGTQITMAFGTSITTKPVEFIQIGDQILSYDPINQIAINAEVTNIHIFTENLPECIIFNHNLIITPKHTMYINQFEWMEANDTIIYDLMLNNIPGTPFINTVPIAFKEPFTIPVNLVFDLEIQPIGLGVVSGYWANGILVGGYD